MFTVTKTRRFPLEDSKSGMFAFEARAVKRNLMTLANDHGGSQ